MSPSLWPSVCVFLLSLSSARSNNYTYQTKWFRVPLDHFGYQRNETFQIKYLENEDHWNKSGGPIFFYTGNEGQIEVFAQHTGFMWEIAEEFKAKLVFAEHRYYGESMPFGKESLDNDHIGYLSSGQALADYADLINFLQDNQLTPKYPVIAFGGSYGGMLAAYIRMKYPHLVDGAIAASAPIHMYPDMVPCGVYYRIVTSSFRVASNQCVNNIRNSWAIIRNFTSSQNGTDWLQKNWKLCDPIKNSTHVDLLMDFLKSTYETLAMVNYPFASDFLVPLPAQPVRVACQYLNVSLEGEKLLEGVGKILELYTNYEGKSKCVNYLAGSDYGNLDASGWGYQACTEMVMPMCTDGKKDMFEPSPWNFTEYSKNCHDTYNVYPQENWARIEYGGNRLDSASDIVFSNGLMDPWAGGGILNSQSDSVHAVVIIDGAHHQDLMPSTPSDTQPVKSARNFHKEFIRQLLEDIRHKDRAKKRRVH